MVGAYVLLCTTLDEKEVALCESSNGTLYVVDVPHEFVRPGLYVDLAIAYPLELLSQETRERLLHELANIPAHELQEIRDGGSDME